jgi:hypothetical protein
MFRRVISRTHKREGLLNPESFLNSTRCQGTNFATGCTTKGFNAFSVGYMIPGLTHLNKKAGGKLEIVES